MTSDEHDCLGVDPMTVALQECQHCHVSRPYSDSQIRLLWRDKTLPRPYIARHELKYVSIILIYMCCSLEMQVVLYQMSSQVGFLWEKAGLLPLHPDQAASTWNTTCPL